MAFKRTSASVLQPKWKQRIIKLKEEVKTMSLDMMQKKLNEFTELCNIIRLAQFRKTKNPSYIITEYDCCALFNFEDIYHSDCCERCKLAKECEKLRSRWEEYS